MWEKNQAWLRNAQILTTNHDKVCWPGRVSHFLHGLVSLYCLSVRATNHDESHFIWVIGWQAGPMSQPVLPWPVWITALEKIVHTSHSNLSSSILLILCLKEYFTAVIFFFFAKFFCMRYGVTVHSQQMPQYLPKQDFQRKTPQYSSKYDAEKIIYLSKLKIV